MWWRRGRTLLLLLMYKKGCLCDDKRFAGQARKLDETALLKVSVCLAGVSKRKKTGVFFSCCRGFVCNRRNDTVLLVGLFVSESRSCLWRWF